MNRNFILLVSYVIGGGLITLFQRYLTFYFDTLTLNFFRFFSGSLALGAVILWRDRAALRQVLRDRRALAWIVVLSLLMLVPQYLVVKGLSLTSAVMGGLINTLGIPLTVILAALVFADEKSVIRNAWVVLGSLLAFGGTMGLTLSKGTLPTGYSLGMFYLTASMVLTVLIMLMLKKMLRAIHPLSLGFLNCACMCLTFFACALLWGQPASIAHTPLWPVCVLLFSGAFGLIIGNGVALVVIKRCGIIITKFSELAMPVVTGVLGIVLLHETMGPREALFALLVLAGCFMILFKDKETIGKIL